jgi:hypothetical protein
MIFNIIYCLRKLDNCPMKFRIGILFTLFNLATINGFSQSLNKVYKFSNSTIRSHFDFVFETNQGYDVFGETLYISGPISGPGIANQDILYMKLDSCGNVMNTFRIGGMEGDFLRGVFINLLGNYDLICERKTPSTQQKDYDILVIELTTNGTILNSNLIKRSATSLVHESVSDVVQCGSGGYLVGGYDDSLPPYSKYNKPSIL